MRAAVVVCAAAALLLAAGDTGAAAADLSLVNGTGSALHRRQDRNRAFQLRSLADTGVSYCVTATGGSTSATVVLLECDENRSLQQWTWTSEGYLQSSSTRCMQPEDDSESSPLVIRDCGGATFSFIGGNRIRSNYGSRRCMDIRGTDTSAQSGTIVQLYSCDRFTSELSGQWTYVYIGAAPDPCAGITCGGHGTCSGGTCSCDSGYYAQGTTCLAVSCPTGQSNCGSTANPMCSTLKQDNANCGTCGNACSSNEQCTNGRCVSTDPCNGISCGSNSRCSGGVCSCNTGFNSPDNSGKNCVANAPDPGPTTASGKTTTAPEPTSVPSLPSGATLVNVEPSSFLRLTSSGGGLSCSASGCEIDSVAKGEFMVTKSAKVSDVFVLRQSSTACLSALKNGASVEPILGSCPSSTLRLGARQTLSSYWTIFNSSGSTKVMNANLGSQTGCLLIPSLGIVSLGSCSSPDAGKWMVSGMTSANPAPASAPSSSNTGAIAGGVVAGILGLAAIAGLVYYLNRRNKKAAAMQQPIGLQDKVPPAPSNNPVVYDSPVNSEPMNYAPVSNAPVNSPSPQNLAPQNLPPVADLGSNGDFYAKQPARLPTPSWGAAPAPANIHEEEAGVFARHGGAAGVNQVDVKTLYKVGGSYMARQPDEISVQAGEEIYIDKAFSDGWVFGVHRSGARGLFPANVLIVPKASGGMAGGAAAPSN